MNKMETSTNAAPLREPAYRKKHHNLKNIQIVVLLYLSYQNT